MRKTLFMLLACLFCVFAQAQTKVEVTLTDGKVVKGTTRTLFSVDDANSIKVKDAKGEKKTYKSTEVKIFVYTMTKARNGTPLWL